jgi:hypothetical protein
MRAKYIDGSPLDTCIQTLMDARISPRVVIGAWPLPHELCGIKLQTEGLKLETKNWKLETGN